MSFLPLPADELGAALNRQIRGFEVQRFIEDLENFRAVALEKVLQTFDDVEADAAQVFESADGVDDFVATVNVRQGMLNLLAVFLWHMFETQRERLNEHSTEHGFDSPSSPNCDAIAELRCAANTIKHGDGRSAETLYDLRPDLFRTPHWTDSDGEPKSPSAFTPPRTLMPLAGEGLYVGPDDLSSWLDAVVAYWQGLSL